MGARLSRRTVRQGPRQARQLLVVPRVRQLLHTTVPHDVNNSWAALLLAGAIHLLQ